MINLLDLSPADARPALLTAMAELRQPSFRAEQVLQLWTLFWLWRSAAVSLSPRRPRFWVRSLAAFALLATPLWFGGALLPDGGWWQERAAVVPRAGFLQIAEFVGAVDVDRDTCGHCSVDFLAALVAAVHHDEARIGA